MIARRLASVAIAMVLGLFSLPAIAQGQRASSSSTPAIGAYATFGRINFAAGRTFDAVLGRSSGPIIGGGARISSGDLFFDLGAWRFQETGERVFVFEDQVYPLGIPLKVTAIPIEFTAGWMFHVRRLPALRPYLAGGLTSMHYREESDFSTKFENDDRTFNGFLARGGAEYRIVRWVAVAGEAVWSSIPDAIGTAGVSEVFGETDLGGSSFRFKVILGR